MRIILTISLIAVLSLNFVLPSKGDIVNDINFINEVKVQDTVSAINSLISTSLMLKRFDPQLSFNAISQAKNLSKESNNEESLAQCTHLAGNVLSDIGKTEECISELKKALVYYEEAGNKLSSASVLLDLGLAYQKDEQYEKSMVYLNSALADYSILSDSLGIAVCHNQIGKSNQLMGNYEDAIIHYNNSLFPSLSLGYEYYIARNYIDLSYALIELNPDSSIIENLVAALYISEKLKDGNLIKESHLAMSNYYVSIGDSVKATSEMKTFTSLNNSQLDKFNKEFEKFLINLASLNKEDESYNISTIIFWIILIILLFIIFYLYTKFRRLNAEHMLKINNCVTEIEAFNNNLTDLNKKTEEKANERISEIEDEIKRNKLNKVAIINSQNNLNKVNQLKDMFLSKISHEIRTPLSGIMGFAEILENQLALDEENDLFEFAKSITDSGQSLVSLLNNLLDISRLNSNNINLDIKAHNIVDSIQEVVNNHTAEANLKGLKLIFDSHPLPEIQTDNQLFKKILALILSNSVKFTEKGFIKISNIEEKDQISVIIKDTGIGIDKVYIDQVFEPYRQESLGYSTSYQGAGLGLPLAKKMLAKLGGDIVLESEIGTGTTVTIALPNTPITDKEPETKTIVEVSEPKSNDEKKVKIPWETLSVLVVEDDSMNQLLYTKILKSAKNLEIAKDGKVALELIEKHLDSENFDLVLMDINLPSPWNGISLMKEIRKNWPVYKKIPFIAQTAYAITGNRETMLEEGFDEYLTKPIFKSALIKSINAVIESK